MTEQSTSWRISWQQPVFRRKMITGFILFIVVLAVLPLFFQAIEKRTGPVLNDFLLKRLPVYNVSVLIFILIWGVALLSIVRAVQSPQVCILMVWTYVFVSVSRMLTIWFFPLDPPVNLLPLIDPLSNTFYGKHYITRDLFYSGHTSSIFLLYLCLKNRKDKVIALQCTIAVAFLLLIQHVHYTIDILFAPVFTYVLYRMAIIITRVQNASPN